MRDIIDKIKEKNLGITGLFEIDVHDGKEREKPYDIVIDKQTISLEILRLMELYDISIEDAITKGVKFIVRSNLDKYLEK